MTADKLPPDLIQTPEQEALRSYINNPDPETKAELLAKYEPMLQEAIAGAIEVINEFKADHPAALQYDREQAFLKLTAKEITFVDYDKDPERQANYELYYSLNQYKLDDLLTYIQILKYPQKKPGKVITTRLIKSVLAAMKRIHAGTNCPINFLADLSTVKSEQAITELFLIYQYEPYVSGRIKTFELYRQQTAYFKRIGHPTDGPDFKQSYENFDLISAKLAESLNKLQAIIDQAGISDLVAGFIQKLQPGERIRQTHTLDKPYVMVLSSPLTKAAKQILNAPGRVRNGKGKGTSYSRTEHAITNKSVIKYKGSDTELEFTLENTKVLFSKGIKSGAKIFNFLLEKLNDQGYSEVTTYSLQELVDNGIYASTRSAYNNLPKILDKMYEISIEGSTTIYQGRKRDPKKFKKTRLIYELSTTNFGINTLSFTPIIREGLKYITILPSWSYYLSDNAFMLLDYIYIIARQQLKTIKTTGSFQVSIEAVRAHLGLMTIKEAGRDPGKLIRNVIEQAIDEIEQMRDKQDAKRDFEESKKSLSSLQITPIFDFGNDTTETFLQGHLKIELDEYGINYMVNRAVDLEKELSKKAKIEEKAEQKALEKKFKSAQE